MKPLFILLIASILILTGIKIITGNYDIPLAVRLAMSVMLDFTSIAHFAFNKGTTMMVPSFIPYKKLWVWCTGIEIAAAIGLMIGRYRSLT